MMKFLVFSQDHDKGTVSMFPSLELELQRGEDATQLTNLIEERLAASAAKHVPQAQQSEAPPPDVVTAAVLATELNATRTALSAELSTRLEAVRSDLASQLEARLQAENSNSNSSANTKEQVEEELRRSMEVFKREVREDIEQLRKEIMQQHQKQQQQQQQEGTGTLERRNETERHATDKYDEIMKLRQQVRGRLLFL